MPPFSSHHSSKYTKFLLAGDRSTGKTGALASLVAAGYKLRILDYDNGMDVLRDLLTSSTSPYKEALKGIDLDEAIKFQTLMDPIKISNGVSRPTKAVAWAKGMALLDNWKIELEPAVPAGPGVEAKPAVYEDLGPARDWGEDVFLVLDSLSFAAGMAMNAAQAMNGRLGVIEVNRDYQQEIRKAQKMVEGLLQLLYDKDFKCNVCVITHMVFQNPEGTSQADIKSGDVQQKAYVRAIGNALSPVIPGYFNNLFQVKVTGSGPATKRLIYTVPQGELDLKNAAPTRLKPSYPVETGLADIVKILRGN